MKKSTAFHTAQLAVLADDLIPADEKLEILRFLMESEDIALYSEKTAAEIMGREE